ncbi:hypothetical protein HK100_001734, partial [Physocladia obscura]
MTVSYDIVELLGETLYGKDNTPVSTASVVATKPYIALYFSASWCPPCQVFTPKLIEFYGAKSNELEIVLISHDHEIAAHNEYFAKMPWLHVPYEQRSRKSQLAQIFQVNGIPSLTLLRSDGSGIQVHNVRSLIDKDPKGYHFPYAPQTIRSVLTDLSDANKSKIDGKTLAIYFESPNSESNVIEDALLNVYNDAKSEGQDFEVLLVSWAKTKEDYDARVGAFPYVKVDFDEKFTTLFHLSNLYNVRVDATHVVVLSPTRNLINNDGGTALKRGRKYPLNALKVVDFADSSISNNFRFEEKPSLLVLSKTSTASAQAHLILEQLAEKYSHDDSTSVCTDEFCELDSVNAKPDIIFFTGTNDGDKDGIIAYLRQLAKFPDELDEIEVLLCDWCNGRIVHGFNGEFSVD